MDLVKFATQYEKDNNIKLLKHQKDILKSMSEGKLFYYNPHESLLQDIIDAFSGISIDKNENL